MERDGLVCSSRVRIAESRSWMVVDAPCIGEPPETFTLALAAGEAVLADVRTLGRSEINGPAAEGGGLEWVADTGVGSCRAAGSATATALETGAFWRERRDADM